jgi:hypothetical protein
MDMGGNDNGLLVDLSKKLLGGTEKTQEMLSQDIGLPRPRLCPCTTKIR